MQMPDAADGECIANLDFGGVSEIINRSGDVLLKEMSFSNT
jgi:hypothetical protein